MMFLPAYSSTTTLLIVGGAGFLGFATLRMGLGRLIGRATTTYYNSPHSLTLHCKDGSRTTLIDLCKSVIPPCNLNPFLFNGHLQTMWTALKSQDVPIYYKRHVFEAKTPSVPGSFAVDFVVPPYTETDDSLPPRTTYLNDAEFSALPSDDTKPMLVVLHGLSGGSHELYLRRVLALLTDHRSGPNSGFEACVVNSRGCAKSKLTSPMLYNARATWDVRQHVQWLRQRFPNRPLYGIGFSLGASMITNYVSEEGSECQLQAALALSCPFDLHAGSLALQRTWLGLNVYSAAMGKSLRALFEQHEEQMTQNSRIDRDLLRRSKYLHEWDRNVQGPTWGYPTEGAYYRDASSVDALQSIRIPFLAIHADDDPVAVGEALPRLEIQQTPYGVLCITSLGGHLSWFEFGGGRWYAKAVSPFLFTVVDLYSRK